jgi:hypothetical protein
VIPFADGGATDAGNLQLRCRAHNAFEAERWSGPGEEDLLREVSPIYGLGLPPVNYWLPGESIAASVRIRLGPGPSFGLSLQSWTPKLVRPAEVRKGPDRTAALRSGVKS